MEPQHQNSINELFPILSGLSFFFHFDLYFDGVRESIAVYLSSFAFVCRLKFCLSSVFDCEHKCRLGMAGICWARQTRATLEIRRHQSQVNTE